MEIAKPAAEAYLPWARQWELPSLAAEEFEKFFKEVHGVEPFPWQVRLAEEVMRTGRWPKRIWLPPGAGLSATIDIAVFHLSLEADFGDQRCAPMRIAHVLDRFCVANAAFDRACRLDKALRSALESRDDSCVLAKVARRLTHLAGTTRPLIVRTLLVGAPQEGDWTPSASQPTVVCSTVDQVGSRLLFRGYGTSDSMKPVQAGLLGADCLLLLDHIHFSAAFRETLDCVESYRSWPERAGAPWMHVTLESTALEETESSFRLTEADHHNPLLSARFHAGKPTHLVLSTTRSKATVRHATELIDHAWSISGVAAGTRGRIVAIIVNTIGLARACQQAIALRIGNSQIAQSLLLIGRSRQLDRERLMRTDAAALVRGARTEGSTLFVVATQSLEAGPDVSFDALVTQIASIDALRLRFSRLNRYGESASSEAIILACQDEVKAGAVDPIYGAAAKATWDWLIANKSEPSSESQKTIKGQQGIIDFGTAALGEQLAMADTTDLISPRYPAPTMMCTYVDLLSQTSPIPAPDPEIGLFLHGAPAAADVLIVWRDDVDLSTAQGVIRAERALELCPPRPQEGIWVPILAARAWLLRQPILPTADVEGAWSVDYFRPPPPLGRSAMRWRGSHATSQRVWAHELRAGDLLVVPSAYGGADEAGWYPNSYELRYRIGSVRDVSEELIAAGGTRSSAFRMHPVLLQMALSTERSQHARYDRSVDVIWRDVWDEVEAAGDAPEAAVLAQRLAEVRGLPRSWVRRLQKAASSNDVTVTLPSAGTDGYSSGIVFVDLESSGSEQDFEMAAQPSTTEHHAPPFAVMPVTVEEYAGRFEALMRRIAPHVVFPEIVMSDFGLAAWLSSEGQRDLRYQGFLRGGDRMVSLGGFRAFATATTLFDDLQSESHARELVKLPEHWCPEAESVRRALLHPRLEEARDKRLVVWLIGTLYGCGRPFYPHSDPENSGPQDLDFLIDAEDWVEIFVKLKERYGVWGLAYFEATFRLCAHRVWDSVVI